MQLKEKRKRAKKEGRDTIEEDDPVKVCVSGVGEGGGGRGEVEVGEEGGKRSMPIRSNPIMSNGHLYWNV